MSTIQDIHRIHDSTRGALRFFNKERERCLKHTNMLYGKVCGPTDDFMKKFASELKSIITRTHHIHSFYVSTSYITIQFPHLPDRKDFKHVHGGEISIYIPKEKNIYRQKYGTNRLKLEVPQVSIREPLTGSLTRRYQLSPHEKPEQVLSRCLRYFDCHLIEVSHQAAA